MIRVALVDDEPPARRKLRHLLSTEPDFSIVAEAETGAEAITALQKSHSDLVFLDIQLPDCSGFDVVDALPQDVRPHIVFVTAFDDYALKAFEVFAIDYLLKPVEPSRFAASLQRIRQTFKNGNNGDLANRLDQLVASLRSERNYIRRLLIQEDDRTVFIEVDRIDWIESARNYTCIHAGAQTLIKRSTLDALASKLDPGRFRRINRSQLVNVERIAEVRSWFHGDQKVLLKDGTELTWSRRFRPSSLEELESGV
jgi:two-component system LytT family response regulator